MFFFHDEYSYDDLANLYFHCSICTEESATEVDYPKQILLDSSSNTRQRRKTECCVCSCMCHGREYKTFLLTLSACMHCRVTVVFLQICTVHLLYIKNKMPQSSLCIFQVSVMCTFHRKCFTQECWCHLLVTTAFLTPSDGNKFLSFSGFFYFMWVDSFNLFTVQQDLW